MTTQLRFHRLIPFLTIAALLAGSAVDVFPQETAKEPAAAGQDGRGTPYDLEIQDGLLLWNGSPRKDKVKRVPANLQNVIALLRELHPEANFALSPGLADRTIADLKMRTSSVEEKLEAIRIASGSDFIWRNAYATPMDPKTGLPATPDTRPLYVLTALAAEDKPRLRVEAFNISTYIKAYGSYPASANEKEETPEKRMEQIERMVIETVKDYESQGLAAKPNAKPLRPPSIKFHPGANLVIVIGEPEAVAVAAKVIGALPGAKRSVAMSEPDSDVPSPESPAGESPKKARPDGSLPVPRR